MLTDKMLKLREILLTQAYRAEKMIEKSISGILEKNAELLREIIDVDEKKVNEVEIEIDEMCTNIIALYHPEARDLRTVLMILKINNDLERIGDMAVNIAESALDIIDQPQIKPYIDLPRMADETIKMLKDSITAFTNNDVLLAKSVCEHDSIVDGLKKQIFRELISLMLDNGAVIERSLHIMRITNNLERIADLSTNIAEDTIFIINGRIIKHHNEDI